MNTHFEKLRETIRQEFRFKREAVQTIFHGTIDSLEAKVVAHIHNAETHVRNWVDAEQAKGWSERVQNVERDYLQAEHEKLVQRVEAIEHQLMIQADKHQALVDFLPDAKGTQAPSPAMHAGEEDEWQASARNATQG